MPNKQYIAYQIAEPDTQKQEILVAMLQDFGFDGFEQTATEVIANGQNETLDQTAAEAYLQTTNTIFTKKIIEEENWNHMWESDFPPIIIPNFCAVRAGFHSPIKNVPYEIIIDPKMSFGTGHHATTYLVMEAMAPILFLEKSVVDFGTGTGLLAILAEKMGANNITAIDYDDWCIENGKENIATNNCHHIQIIKADNLDGVIQADIVLANINKNIILDNFAGLKRAMHKDGILLISGILTIDQADIVAAANSFGLKMVSCTERNGWLCILFTHAA